MGLVAYVSPQATAATRTWDGGGSDSSWGTKNNWSSNSAPGTNDSVVFNGSSAGGKYNISLGANRTILGLTFSAAAGTNAFTISGNTLTLTSAGIVNSDADTQTFSSTVAVGTTSQTFDAASGGLTFNAVTLNQNLTLSGSGAITIGSNGGALLNSGGNRTLTINTGGSRTIGAINLSNDNTARTLTINGAGSATVTGVIANGGSGAGNLTKSGTGTLTLSGVNTYTGTTTVSQGTLQLGAANRLADTSALTVSGGTFDVQSFNDTVGAITLTSGTIAGTGTLTGSSYALQGGTVNANLGTGTATITSGTTTLNGTLGASTVNINSGTLTLGASDRISNSAAVTVAGGALNLGSFSDTIGSFSLSAGALAGSGTLTASSFAFSNSSDVGVAAVLAGSGSLTKTGAGTLTLSGANTYTGATIVNGGTLQLSASNHIADTSNLEIGASGTFQFNWGANSETVGALSGSGTLALRGSTFTTSTSADTVFSGTITDSYGVFRKDGTGKLTLSGNNTYTGKTYIDGGTLIAASSTALGGSTSGNVIASGATLALQGDITLTEGSFSVQGTGDGGVGAIYNLSGNNALNATLNLAGATTLGSASGTLTLGNLSLASDLTLTGAGNFATSGQITTGGTLIKNGTGTLTLSGTGSNSYGATNLNEGTIVLGKSDGISALGQGAITIGDNSGAAGSAVIRLAANDQIVNYAPSITFNSDGRLDLNGYSESLNVISGSAGEIALGGGNLTLGVNSGSSSFGGVITGAGTLTKIGSGVVTLSGANSYSAATAIDVGTLRAGAANTFSSASSVTLANTSGATLDLNGFDQTIGSLAGGGASGGNVSLGSATLTTGGNGASTSYAGVISGTGSLTKIGAGTLTLSGANNTFSGGVTVSGGTLLAQGTTTTGGFGALGNYSGVVTPTTVITVNNGATLAVQNTTPGFVMPATDTTLLLTMSLSGSGTDGTGALKSLGGRNTWRGNVSLAGNTTINNTQAGNDNTLFLGPYIQISPTTFDLNNNNLNFIGQGDVYISSAIGKSSGDTGSVSINLTNGGMTNSVTFAGPQNSYTGTTEVNNGWLRLLVDSGNYPNAAIKGSLVIGDGTGAANSAVVTNAYIEQIADNASVTIKSDGLLDLATHSVNETLSNLTLQGGRINTGTGNLYLTGPVSVQTGATSTIDGNIGLQNAGGGPARTFNVDAGSTFLVNARIFGGDYIKAGDGTMIVTSDSLSSGYNGRTTVAGGILNLRNSGALGQHANDAAASGTIVQNGATLQLDNTLGNVAINYERLTLSGSGAGGLGALNSKSGSNSWSQATIIVDGDTTIRTDAGTLTLGGRIGSTAAAGGTQTLTVSGSGNTFITGSIKDNIGPAPTYSDLHTGQLALTKNGSGTLSLSGANTFSGAINVNQGTLAVTASNVLGAQTNRVTVASGATFAVSGGNDYTNTIGRLEGSGVVSIAAATNLRVNNTTADTFDGRLSGSGLFNKIGSDTFTFSSTANTSAFNFDGTVQLSAGTMEFKGGSSSSALFVENLTLLGGTTLFLNEAYINVGTLYITGNTILDFGTGSASILNASNIYIADGAILTVRNWTSEVDFLFATNSGYATSGGFRLDGASGTLAEFNQIGSQPSNQVHFEGDPQSPDGSHTTWINYDHLGYTNWEIRPIPEPSTYGAILIGSALAFLGFRRFRASRVTRR